MGARIGIVLLAVAMAWTPSAVWAQQPDASLRGLVTALDRGAPVTGAKVLLDSVTVGVTDPAGKFFIDGVEPGEYRLQVLAVGFQPYQVIINLAEAKAYMVELALQPGAQVLEAVTVEALRLPRNRVGEIVERMAWRRGDFILRSDLEALQPQETSFALAFSRKVRLQYVNVGECFEQSVFGPSGEASPFRPGTPGSRNNIRADQGTQCGDLQGRATIQVLMGRGFRRCLPSIYLDGVRMQLMPGQQVDDLINPHDIELIEIYGEFEVPGEFSNADVGCGVIAIWARSG